jgi:voltage-gated potassium channel Kch
MIEQFFIGAALIGLTVLIHAIAIDRLMKLLEHIGPWAYKNFQRSWHIPLLIITVLGVFGSHIVQIWIWAELYLFIGALNNLEEALYFSTTTFTTVGYGDLILGTDWRLLSSFQSANGFILFGWSTAFIFEVMSKLYKQNNIKKTEKA